MVIPYKKYIDTPTTYPTIYSEFIKDNFVTQKSQHKFSALDHDQVHEQLNAMVKGDGEVIGITENETALKRWMVAGPEVARLLMEHEDKHSVNKKCSEHHKQLNT